MAKAPGVRHHQKEAGTVTVCVPGLEVDNVPVMWPKLLDKAGKTLNPPFYYELKAGKERQLEKYRKLGASGRKIAEATGRGDSTVGRQRDDAQDKLLAHLNSRPLGHLGITAVQLDGKKLDGRTLMVATGITVDGRKLTLGLMSGSSESEKLVGALLRNLVDRGLDTRVVFIADQGIAIRNAIDALCAPQQPTIQLCAKHKAARVQRVLEGKADVTNVAGAATPDYVEGIRKRMWRAWGADDFETGRARMDEIAADLDAAGFDGAARTLLNDIDLTFTVMRLGVRGDLLRQLQSTNDIESRNAAIRQHAENVGKWKDDDQRERWGAEANHARDLKAPRLADVEGMIALNARVLPGTQDSELLLSQAPPMLTTRQLTVAKDDATAARQAAAKELGAGEKTYIGGERALARAGVDYGQPVAEQELASLLRGCHATDGTSLRPIRKVGVGDGGAADGREKVDGLAHLRYVYTAPTWVTWEWEKAGPEYRAEIRQAVMASAEVALASVTSSSQPGHGFVGTARVVEPSGPGERFRVEGLVVAVDRRGKDMASPVTGSLAMGPGREAEDAGKVVLERTLTLLGWESPTAARAPAELALVSDPYAEKDVAYVPKDSLAEYRHLIGAKHHDVIESMANAREPQVELLSDNELVFHYNALLSRTNGGPFHEKNLNRPGAYASATLQRDKDAAEADVRRATGRIAKGGADADTLKLKENAQRSLENIRERAQQLKQDGIHVDQWMMEYREPAAAMAAMERVAARRGLQLGRERRRAPAQEKAARVAETVVGVEMSA